MVGHSDFVPVGQNESEILQESPDRLGRGNYLIDGSGEAKDLILATESSEVRGRPPRDKALKPAQRAPRPLNDSNLMLVVGTNKNDRTNTMDFIDKMINQGSKEDPPQSNLKNISDEFKIPEYDGIQTSLMSRQK